MKRKYSTERHDGPQLGTIGLKLKEALDRKIAERAAAANTATVKSKLSAIDADIEQHPERLQPVSPQLLASIDALVGDVKVDLDEPIDGDVKL